ncbi:hypothetical protein LCGC14_0273610 [marine sediment metagenome]|uniref:Uncharacterized protein n=2 Tax=root TaxID=1 RepID=A0A9C9NJW2_9HYPH|nr:hypothetical protein [Aurantimonas coralicida]
MSGTSLGKTDGRPGAQDGGLAIRVDTVDQGVRNNINFRNTPGVRWAAVDDPTPPARMIVTAELDAEVLLAPPVTGLDLATGTVLATLLTAIAAQLMHVTRVVLIATDISGLTVQPTVQLGTDVTVPSNLASPQALALTATGQIQELALADPRPGVDAGPSVFDEAILDQTVAATATTYEVTAQIWGVVLTP